MKISELVHQLQGCLLENGDLEVVIDPCAARGDLARIEEIGKATDHDDLVIGVCNCR